MKTNASYSHPRILAGGLVIAVTRHAVAPKEPETTKQPILKATPTNRFLTRPTLAALLLAALAGPPLCRSTQVDAHISLQGLGNPPPYNQTSPTGPLGTSLSGPYSSAGGTFAFGAIDIQAAGSEDNQGYGGASANGDWMDTITINDPALTGMQGVARFTYHLSGSVQVTEPGLEDVNSNFSLTLPSGANYQGGYHSNQLGYQGYQVSDLATVTDDVSFTFGTPFDISVGFGGGVSPIWDHQSSAGGVNLSLSSGGLTVLSGSDPVDPSSYTTSSTSGTDYAVSVPEPSTWMTLASGIAMLLGFQRRKRSVTKKV